MRDVACGKSRRQRINTLGYIDAVGGTRHVRRNSGSGEIARADVISTLNSNGIE